LWGDELYGMCSECFEMLDKNKHKNPYQSNNVCKHCSKISHVIEVDELILPTISELNKKGYYTDFCCSGHALDSFIDNGSINNLYIMFDKNTTPNSEPNLIDLHVENTNFKTIYRHIFKKQNNYYDTMKEIIETNSLIYEWAKNLQERRE
jgi:hypothetical protein